MKVYVLLDGIYHEGASVVAVYADTPDAKVKAQRALNARERDIKKEHRGAYAYAELKEFELIE